MRTDSWVEAFKQQIAWHKFLLEPLGKTLFGSSKGVSSTQSEILFHQSEISWRQRILDNANA
jgi:hypothetical protein